MASAATIVNRTILPNGDVDILFSDGISISMTQAGLEERIRDIDSDPDRMRFIAIAYWKARDASFGNINLVKDKAIVFDLSNNNPIRLDANSNQTGVIARAGGNQGNGIA